MNTPPTPLVEPCPPSLDWAAPTTTVDLYPMRYMAEFWPDHFAPRGPLRLTICARHNVSFSADDEEGCPVCRGLIDPPDAGAT
jgi:hypothetical protein